MNTPPLLPANRTVLVHLRTGLPTPNRWRWLTRLTPLPATTAEHSLFTALQHASRTLHRANHIRLRPATRLAMTDALAQWLWPLLLAQLEQITHDQRNIAETPGQRELYAHLERTIDALLTAYRLVLAADYSPSLAPATPAGQRLTVSAARIFDWLQYAQRLSMARYRPLAAVWWRIANTVFGAVASVAADHLAPAALTPALYSDTPAPLRQRYLTLQLFGLFDSGAWSRGTPERVIAYCHPLPDHLRLLPVDPAVTWPAGSALRFTGLGHAAPAVLTPLVTPLPQWALDCRPLAAMLQQDYQALFASGGGTPPARLHQFPRAQQRPLLRLLTRDMDEGVTYDEPALTQTDPESEMVWLRVGFVPVREHLRMVFSRSTHATPKATSSGRSLELVSFSNYAAATRVPRTHKHRLVPHSQWTLLDQRARRLWMATADHRAAAGMTVGNLVVYGIGGKTFLRHPLLARVARIAQTAHGALVAELQMLAQFATLVAVRPTAADTGVPGKRLAGLLLYDADFGWGIATLPHDQLTEGSAIELATKQFAIPSRLRRLREATAEVLLYQIDANDPQLTTPPAYPQRRRRHQRPTTPVTATTRATATIDVAT